MKINPKVPHFILFSISLFFASGTLFSQNKAKGYQWGVDINLIGSPYTARVNVSTVHGYRVSPSFFIGGGIGVTYKRSFALLDGSLKSDGYGYSIRKPDFFTFHQIPIFVRGKGYFKKNYKLNFIWICDVGGALGRKIKNVLIETEEGVYYQQKILIGLYLHVNPHIGFSFLRGKKRDRSFDLTIGIRNEAEPAFELRFGYGF